MSKITGKYLCKFTFNKKKLTGKPFCVFWKNTELIFSPKDNEGNELIRSIYSQRLIPNSLFWNTLIKNYTPISYLGLKNTQKAHKYAKNTVKSDHFFSLIGDSVCFKLWINWLISEWTIWRQNIEFYVNKQTVLLVSLFVHQFRSLELNIK